MTSPTKADLQAEVARLGEEVAALRDFIAAVHQAASAAPPARYEDRDAERDQARKMLDVIRDQTRRAATSEYSLATLAGVTRSMAADAPGYEPYEPPAAPVPVSEQNLPAPCPATPPDSAPGQCARLDGHPLPHRTLGGFEWGTPEHCGERPCPAGSEGDDGTECMLPAGHAGPHDDAERADGGRM